MCRVSVDRNLRDLMFQFRLKFDALRVKA
jgi:hypothetical protein